MNREDVETWTRVKTKQKAKNDLDEMDAAASKLALAYKKSSLRRVLTQMGKNCV